MLGGPTYVDVDVENMIRHVNDVFAKGSWPGSHGQYIGRTD